MTSKIKSVNIILACLFIMILELVFLSHVVFAQVNTNGAQVDTSNAGFVKVAPGELLPISVKLSNFGGGKKIDVLVRYSIFNTAGDEVYLTSDTVAVETTASFIKTIQIPFDMKGGMYIAKTFVTYPGQLVPAATQFTFSVEKKILGIFQNDFFLYAIITTTISLLMVLFAYILIKRHKKARFAPIDYSNIPHDKRTFFEILSDTIMQMRQRVGDDALLIAEDIDGLKIDKETGRVLAMDGPPAKIIATLVSEYEKKLSKKVSFSFRGNKSI